MRGLRRSVRLMAAVGSLALVATACGGSSGGGAGTAGEKPVEGGHLKLLGGGDIDHLDTASAYYSVTYSLLRAVSRQLVSYRNDADEDKANEVVPDMVESLPEISADGLTYTLTI